jgi:hypothetical protein
MNQCTEESNHTASPPCRRVIDHTTAASSNRRRKPSLASAAMAFLLRFVPKKCAVTFGIFRNDLRRRASSSSSAQSASASLFEQTIDLPPPEFQLPLLRSLNDAPPSVEKPSILQSMQQGMRQHLSISHQQGTIVNAELLFQAVYQQANNPYVFLVIYCFG